MYDQKISIDFYGKRFDAYQVDFFNDFKKFLDSYFKEISSLNIEYKISGFGSKTVYTWSISTALNKK